MANKTKWIPRVGMVVWWVYPTRDIDGNRVEVAQKSKVLALVGENAFKIEKAGTPILRVAADLYETKSLAVLGIAKDRVAVAKAHAVAANRELKKSIKALEKARGKKAKVAA